MNNFVSYEEADIVFVADAFLQDYAGGGERSTEALYKTSPYKISKVYAKDVDQQLISQGVQKTWVFFNYRTMDHNLIPFIIQNLYYFVVEYDFKFCQYRSLELHKIKTNNECDCADSQLGKIISTFYHGAEHVFYMSDKQREVYQSKFPFLTSEKNTTLSSIFEEKDLVQIENLRKTRQENGHNNKWAIVDGNSWIKGIDDSKKILNESGESFDLLGGLSYSDLLRKLSEYKGLCATPIGADTCPRLVIEAKLLGLDLKINENVLHQEELWFSKDLDQIEIYLLEAHNRFWNTIAKHVERDITVSGYTQAYNVMKSSYPWRESISSLLNFCDEVIVLDGGSDDGTYEELQKWAAEDTRLIVKQLSRDWNSKRFALFDGQQKAAARTLCSKQWCWQSDIDEVVHENDYKKIKPLLRQMPKSVKMLALPVIEYWGGTEKVRVDINPWKQRLSKNDPHITHGVPADHRCYDEEGDLFSIGSDGCDYIHNDAYAPISGTNFYTPELHQVRTQSIQGDKQSLVAFENYMNKVVEQLPGVHHYSWFDIKRKIMTYKNYWSKHWASLYNKQIEDIAENNMFFDKPWSEVSEEEIDALVNKMKEELGGWVFHERIDFQKPTPWMKIEKGHPIIMKEWLKSHGSNG